MWRCTQWVILLPQITAIFWDVGGVLLSNAWDREQRRHALEHFKLDEAEFNDRHEMVVSSFERGKISLDQYLERTIFYRKRPFTPAEFQEYMFSLSQPFSDVLELARGLSKSAKYLMCTMNNESQELNEYRIGQFGLRDIFALFLSSCYVGLRKPEEGIYHLALEVTQKMPEECCFIDDRALNLEGAARLGMHTIRMANAEQLRAELLKLGIAA
jgi:putative hydrolase of the HAD superfamily